MERPRIPTGTPPIPALLYDANAPYSFEFTEFTNPSNSLTIHRGSAADDLVVTGLVASEFDAQLNLGTSGAEFDQVELASPISLSAGKGITIHGQSIQARANITTDNGALNWNAVGDISISGRILTNGGVQTLNGR